MGKYLITFLFFIWHATSLQGQIDYKEIVLDYGNYDVGFRNVVLVDSTRSYSRMMDYSKDIFRPISISIWEPAQVEKCSKRLAIKDYLEVLKNEEEYETLPFEYFFDWFYIPPTVHNVNNSKQLTRAISCYKKVDIASPVIIYSASFRASSTENFILCEYLASKGYRVLAIPSKGDNNKNFEGGSIKDANAQSRDVDFVIGSLNKLGIKESEAVYLSGFSFGGLSHILNAANNHTVDGVISLDGTIKYRPNLLDEAFNFNSADFKVPYIHFSQKDIPHEILNQENLDTAINNNFYFFDSIASAVRYQVKSNYLSHKHFSSYGILFREDEPLQDSEHDKVLESYEKLTGLFHSSLQHLSDRNPESESSYDDFISDLTQGDLFEIIEFVENTTIHFTFKDHVEISRMDSFFSIGHLFDSIVNIHSDYYPLESDLNTLGLQYVLNKDGYNSGVNIFKFAIRLYPESANLYDSIAEGHRYNGKTALAIEAFEKSLLLYPGNSNAIKRLTELKKNTSD